ncbi:MAG: hypothetical protein U0414_38485 [Polyangiaceae bacterium]
MKEQDGSRSRGSKVVRRRYGAWVSRAFLAASVGAIAYAGCGGGDTGSNAACTVSSDCVDGEVCIRIGSESRCTTNCSVRADACGGEASCEGVGSVGVNVCQEKKPAPTPDNPPDPKEEPHLPCGGDAECAALASGAVCGTWMGTRDCTILCTSDSQCNPPAVGGIGTSFFGCKPDESDATRTVCLPREECFQDPLSCITGLPTGTTSGVTSGGATSGGFGGGF